MNDKGQELTPFTPVNFHGLTIDRFYPHEVYPSNIFVGQKTINVPGGSLIIDIYPPHHHLEKFRPNSVPNETNVDEVVLSVEKNLSGEFVGVGCAQTDENEVRLHIASSRTIADPLKRKWFELNIIIKDGTIVDIWHDDELSILQEKTDGEVVIKSGALPAVLLKELGLPLSFKEEATVINPDGTPLFNFEEIIERMCQLFKIKENQRPNSNTLAVRQ